MMPIAPGEWKPGAFTSAKAVRAGKNKIRITLKGELPRWGYDIDLSQSGPSYYELKWRSSSCMPTRNGPMPFERTWEFTGNFRRLRTIKVSTSGGERSVPLTSRKGK